MTTPRTLFPDFDPLGCLCLDAEFASHRDILEMLELTMIDSEGTVIYNHRFRPARMKRWNLVPHNITPEAVAGEPSFASCRPSIQRILDGADYIMGFALENDLRRLEAQGTQRLEAKRIIELRDWFWMIYGRRHGLDYSQDVGLARCCSELGIDIDPEQAHGAAYDTTVTLRCFHLLLEQFLESHAGEAFASFDDIFRRFTDEFTDAKKAYDLEAARGHCAIYRLAPDPENPAAPARYLFKASRNAPDPDRRGLMASITVENRRKAILDLSQMLDGRIHSSSTFKFDRLTDRTLARFRAYTNASDIDELNFARNIMRLTAAFPSATPSRRR